MIIIIPIHWINIVCGITWWTCFSVLWFFLITFGMVKVHDILKRRGTVWIARAFITTKKQRARAEEYTIFQFQKLAENLLKTNPKFHRQIGILFDDTSDGALGMEDLLFHAYIHNNYQDCGFMQMTTSQKRRFVNMLKARGHAENAERLEDFIAQ